MRSMVFLIRRLTALKGTVRVTNELLAALSTSHRDDPESSVARYDWMATCLRKGWAQGCLHTAAQTVGAAHVDVGATCFSASNAASSWLILSIA